MDLQVRFTCIEISITMLLYGWLVARLTGSWSHPAAIYAVFWFGMSLLPLLAVWAINVDPWAMVYILATVVAFGLPAFCYDWAESNVIARSRRNINLAPKLKPLWPVFFAIQTLTFACIAINISRQGVSIPELLADPVSVSNRYIAARYSGAIETNIFSQLGIVLNYIAAPIAGMIIAQQKMRRSLLLTLICAFTPSLLHIIVYGDKGTIFLVGAYFFGGVLTSRIMRGDTSLINAATIKAGLIAFALMAPVLVFAMLSRGGGDWKGIERFTKVLFYLNSYSFGHLFAFSDWFHHYFFDPTLDYTNPNSSTLGFFTFLPIGRLILPAYQLPPGIFDEYFLIPDVMKTNIYTIFRPLIADFGLVGSLVFMMAWGLISSISYNAMLRQAIPPVSQAFFVLTIGWIYTSYIISLLIWSSIYAATTGLALLLIANKARLKSQVPPR